FGHNTLLRLTPKSPAIAGRSLEEKPMNLPGNAAGPSPREARDWLRSYPPSVPASLTYPDVPLSALLDDAAQGFPDRTACTLYDHATTYAQLAGQARNLAAALANLGARPGRFVGLLLPNVPDYIVALQATWLTGATALQLSPLMVAED